MVDNVLSLLNKQRNGTAVVVYKPKYENINPNEKKLLQTKFIALTKGKEENCDMIFLNSCQSKCLRTKLLGYLGAEMFLSAEIKFMILNTLRRDLVDTLTLYRSETTNIQEPSNSKTRCLQKMECKKHKIICIQNIPFNTKFAIYYLLNSKNEQIREIEDEIQFVCDPIYLLLFYKFWTKEIDQQEEGIFDCIDESESDEAQNNYQTELGLRRLSITNDHTSHDPKKECDEIEESLVPAPHECTKLNDSISNSVEDSPENREQHMKNKDEHEGSNPDLLSPRNTSKSKDLGNACEEKSVLDKTLSDLFKDRGYHYPFKTKKEKKKQAEKKFDVAKYTRNYFLLRITRNSVDNGTIFIKLQILLEQTRINLRRNETDFLYDFFRETKCTIMKIKIIQVLTKVTNICDDEKWYKAIKNKVNFSGIYSLSTTKLALLFECLEYLLVHKLYDKEIDLFLYRLFHAVCPNMVFCALQLLRIRKINRRQVIERCLRLISSDGAALETLIEYIDTKTYKFAFKQLLEQNLIFEESKKIDMILKRMLEVSDDKFKMQLVKKYQFLGEKYHITTLITDKQILSELRRHLMNDLTETSIYFIAEIFEKGLDFPKESDYTDFFERGMEILLHQYQRHIKGQCHKQDHPSIDSQIYRNISFLISLGLKHGNPQCNKNVFENFLEKTECNGIRRIIEENLEFFNFIS